ncbi:prevent-host-death protein [Ectothiorhodospira haloalkaliphila]|uniref:Antitoxin n=1 Tax=Ectothiorhodospira haloalkaliphila TaxID=421628 RepID=W8L6E5_9GAMM|nr:type II toxin-antitoxin system prevent-host-death family antitoxin [Ectothiorhodospira haloalkaliphila]AHK79450.1 prevent-host-death protein [Ectothiorhodospira haloalkaliphila]
MQTMNVRETRERLSQLLDAVAQGEEIVILRHGKPAARLTAPQSRQVRFLDRSTLRAALPPSKESAAAVVRHLRNESRY